MRTYSPRMAIVTIARREFSHALRSKGMILTIVLTALVLCGGIFVYAHVSSENSSGKTIAVSGFEPVEDSVQPYMVTSVEGSEQAKKEVVEGNAAVALVKDGSTFDIIHDGPLPGEVRTMISLMIMGDSFETVLNLAISSGVQVDPATIVKSVNDIDIEDNSGAGVSNFNDVVVTLFGISILIMAILLFSATIGGRVTEEKSSRVVEILLATVRPVDLLAGKILGNVSFGLLATFLLLLLGTGSLRLSGLFSTMELNPVILPVMFVAFVIGMVFFGTLYAAAGALVQRTEDLQSTQAPIMFLIFATLYTPSIFFGKSDTWWMQMFAWLPPLSIGNAPLQFAAGHMSLLQFGLSMGIMVIVTAGTIFCVAKIYRFAILNNGSRITWAMALRGVTAAYRRRIPKGE